MNLQDLLAISGKPGLFKAVSRSKSGVIVESLLDGKRTNASGRQGISSLQEISMFTVTEEIPLEEVMRRIAEKEDNGPAIDPRESADRLHRYFSEILPDYDRERVYDSHLRKLFQWYNLLQSKGMVSKEKEEEKKDAE